MESKTSTGLLNISRQGNNSDKTPFVFIHGWGNNSTVWQALVEYFNDVGDILFIDLPGFGCNENCDIDELDTLYSEIEKLLPKRAHLVGWSLGGMIAAQLAYRYPERVKSLISIASNAKFVAETSWPNACNAEVFAKFLQAFQQNPEACFSRFTQLQAQGDRARKQVLNELRAKQAPPTEKHYIAWERTLNWLATIDNRNILPELQMPHLTIFGEKDGLLPAQAGEDFIREKMSQSVEIIEDASHVPHLSQTQKVADTIKKFIAETVQPYARNKKQVAKSFSAAAKNYDSIAHLQHEVANQLVATKESYQGDILDLGCGTGFCIEGLGKHQTQNFGIDIAEGMLKHCREKNIPASLICADIDQLPIASQSLDGLVSSFSLQWCQNLSHTYGELRRVLKNDGWLLFSTLGPDTLYELRQAWQKVDRYVHINQFESFENVVAALEKNAFVIEKKITERRVLEYDNVIQLMRELKGIGAHNVNAGQRTGLTTRRQLRCLESSYETFRINGKLPASYEVYYFLARATV